MSTLYITDAGVAAANNASSAGVLVDLVYFKIGTSNQIHSDTDLDIHGTIIYQGPINFIETQSNAVTRFVFDVPEHVGTTLGTEIHEVAVYLSNGVMFGRSALASPYLKKQGEGLRINAVLSTNRCDLSVINVTLGEYSAVPAVPYVRRLPDPSSAEQNVVAVHDLRHNADTTVSPGLAMRYGSGNQWAFSGYERVQVFNPDASGLTLSVFKKSGLATQVGLSDQELVIVQIIGGPGAPQVRKFRYIQSSDQFNENDGEAFLSITTASTLVLWKQVEGTTSISNAAYPPVLNIPQDWVLTRGSVNPIWAPQRTKVCSLNTLFTGPSALRLSTIAVAGDDRTSSFSLGGLVPENPNYIYCAISGITQHRTAFDLVPYSIEMSEAVPAGSTLDLCIFTKEAHDGKRVDLQVVQFVGDGTNLRFALPVVPEASEYVWVFVAGFKQAVTAFTIDTNTNELVFTEAPGPGIAIEIVVFLRSDQEGYSTKILSTKLLTKEPTYFLELPVAPQNKQQVMISMNGIHIHNNQFSVSGNIIALTGPISKNRDVEVLIFHNERAVGTPQTDLAGVVTDAILTSKTLSLLRHNDWPIKLPVPGINLEAGTGIRVSGTHPDYKIENTIAEFIAGAPPFKYSTLHLLEDAEEIVFTHRIDLTNNLMLTITADFSAILGPGFSSPEGQEIMEYAIGFRTTSAREPDYGRRIKGTGQAGFCSLAASGVNNYARSNASLTQTFDILVSNIPAKFIDIVAKMRVKNAQVNIYGSELSINFNLFAISVM